MKREPRVDGADFGLRKGSVVVVEGLFQGLETGWYSMKLGDTESGPAGVKAYLRNCTMTPFFTVVRTLVFISGA